MQLVGFLRSCNCLPISIHVPYKGCNWRSSPTGIIKLQISIHAPYKGCNVSAPLLGLAVNISIHAPYKGCNIFSTALRVTGPSFQSMHPIKDATWLNHLKKGAIIYFNPCTL